MDKKDIALTIPTLYPNEIVSIIVGDFKLTKMYLLLIVVLTLVIVTYLVLQLPVFGRLPKGKRLEKLRQLPNYGNGAIENLSPTPTKPEDVSWGQMLSKVIKGNVNGVPPKAILPLVPDFSPSESLKMTWFGHSSYLIQVDGLNLLVDPVFSARTSPFQFIGTQNFPGTDFIKAEDLPSLDIVLITHDHYDHLDYGTILKLKNKTKHFITSLGAGSHLERWGIKPDQLTELAWGETAELMGLSFTAAPARHFTGRKFKRNQTLWSSFVLKTKIQRLYLGGDSGYDTHFKNIGQTYGPFDLAILECGQYNDMWPYIHMFPEEVVQASIDLGAQCLLPVHWGKFKLAIHDWDDPIKRVTAKADELGVQLVTPQLGQTFSLENKPQTAWWKEL
ncbi:MBL fold metallo-hydrolase [Pedobacter sp. KR3-3]|uniref:MBL fold metallo-hydrolase n=1 Tax=Pedobacter albus TaxID=3113905 RepID=A0ABU7I3X2_9SPHI|nr:MBL fold metallo-hydrolase [Pedobacter sp. KR3-3]MEE1944123.1 MBL fold metallo-hydrolase [Pedobacter sp. KR3-3]